MLWHAVRASRWLWLACIRFAAEAIWSSEVWAQAFDIKLGKDVPCSGYVEPISLWRGVREDPEGAHPPRGEQRARREGRVLRVEQHLAPHSELHIPPGGFELRLAPVLPVLQQRHTPQSLARAQQPRQTPLGRVQQGGSEGCGDAFRGRRRRGCRRFRGATLSR